MKSLPIAASECLRDLASSMGATLLWVIFGVLIAVAALKVFDVLTPGKLADQVFKERSVSAAIVYGAVFLGVCLIVASAIH